MECHLYMLRDHGARRAIDAILAEPPLAGWLAFARPNPWGMPERDAVLLVGDRRGATLATLHHASVRRIEGGLLLAGQDYHVSGSRSTTAQMWAAAHTEAEVRAMVAALRRKSEVVQDYWARHPLVR